MTAQSRYTVTLVITVKADGSLVCYSTRNTPTGRESQTRTKRGNRAACAQYYWSLRTWADIFGQLWRDECRIVVRTTGGSS